MPRGKMLLSMTFVPRIMHEQWRMGGPGGGTPLLLWWSAVWYILETGTSLDQDVLMESEWHLDSGGFLKTSDAGILFCTQSAPSVC